MKNAIRRLENAHVAFWLIKDYSWCTSTKWLALAMIGPTLVFAVYIAYRTRRCGGLRTQRGDLLLDRRERRVDDR